MRTRWEDVSIRIYVDGSEAGTFKATSLSFDDRVEAEAAKYQGDSVPTLDGHYMGGTGSIEFRLESGFDDPSNAFETQKQAIKDRDPTAGVIRLTAYRRNPKTGAQDGRRFDNCIVQQADRSGENQAYSISWNFTCQNIERI